MIDYTWLNDDARTFLSRGYLKEGVTAEERVRKISETAEKYLNLPGFADKFEQYMANGWFSLATPDWCNFGEPTGLPISCVAGDSWINTKIGGGKQAKDIQIGDEVLTHKGHYRKILNVIKTENKDDIYNLKVYSRMTPIKITGNHKVKTNLGWIRVDELDKKIHLVAINGDLKVDLCSAPHIIDLTAFAYDTYEVSDSNLLEKKNKF